MTQSMSGRTAWIASLLFFYCLSVPVRGQVSFGIASADITPDYPIRLNGYASRTNQSEGVELPIYTKALAMRVSGGKTGLFITVDNCGITKEIRDELVHALQANHSLAPEQIVIVSSHTHYAPALKGSIANMFVTPLPREEQATIDRYTRELVGGILSTSVKAIERMSSGKIFFTRGKVSFAKNRRTEGGPVDHDLPMLVLKDSGGTNRAVIANYACHCTSMAGNVNRIHPDWAGVGQALVQQANPGLTALVSIGCGADSNPLPRGTIEHPRIYGRQLADEMQRLLNGPLTEITEGLQFRGQDLELPFDPLPSREEWRKRAAEPGILGFHARRNLERLDRGEQLPSHLPYYVQTWNFGSQLAMVFLAGEVVVDYSLTLKSMFDPKRLWVSSYANWVPCYIPSRRILREGGYEAESSMWYYDRPTRLSPETEDRIISSVQGLLPKTFVKAGD